MNIITLNHPKFNRLNKIYYGPQQIPKWHELYQKKCWRCGWYERKLILYDKIVITLIIYRFYCPETKKTYSLLPFFINRYERHINTVIEDALREYFIEGISAEKLAEEPSPSPWTIRRWIKKFQDKLDYTRQKVEEFLIGNVPDYRPTAAWRNTNKHKFIDFLNKADLLPIGMKNLHLFGSLSYLYYVAAIQESQL